MKTKGKILVIDDSHGVQVYLQNSLESAGYDVATASNGKEGFEIINQFNPDAVITDIFMPEMDGLEVIMKLKRRFPLCKIVAISGGSGFIKSEILSSALLLGAYDVLLKPFNQEELIEKINLQLN